MQAPQSPIALFVNQESRAEALKTYTRIELKSQCDEWHRKAPITFFDCKLDTLLVNAAFFEYGALALVWNGNVRETYIESLSQIQNLKITEWRFKHVSAEHVWQTNFQAMKGLKTVVFVRTDPTLNQHRFGNGIAADCINLHRQLFEELRLIDPTRSVPVVAVEDPYADLSNEEIMASEE